MGSNPLGSVITDDPIGINFDEDKFSYQVVRDRIMITIYGNTGIPVDSGLGDPGGINRGGRGRRYPLSSSNIS